MKKLSVALSLPESLEWLFLRNYTAEFLSSATLVKNSAGLILNIVLVVFSYNNQNAHYRYFKSYKNGLSF